MSAHPLSTSLLRLLRIRDRRFFGCIKDGIQYAERFEIESTLSKENVALMSDNIERNFMSYLRVERGLSTNTLSAYQSDLEKLQLYAREIGKDLVSIERQ